MLARVHPDKAPQGACTRSRTQHCHAIQDAYSLLSHNLDAANRILKGYLKQSTLSNQLPKKTKAVWLYQVIDRI